MMDYQDIKGQLGSNELHHSSQLLYHKVTTLQVGSNITCCNQNQKTINWYQIG